MKNTGYSKIVPYIAKMDYLPKWKKKILHIFDPVFRQNYWVFDKSWKQKDLADYLGKYNCEVNIEGNSGKFWGIEKLDDTNTSMGVIWFTELYTLTHECIHATNWFATKVGIKYDDELTAYYTEFLFKVIAVEYKLIK